MDREASEGDALEQQQPVGDAPEPERPSIGIEVPEADAIEQSQAAAFDDDDDIR